MVELLLLLSSCELLSPRQLLTALFGSLFFGIIFLTVRRLRAVPFFFAYFFLGAYVMAQAVADLRPACLLQSAGEYHSFTAILIDVPQVKGEQDVGEFLVTDGSLAGQRLRLHIRNDSASLHFRGQIFPAVHPQLGAAYSVRTRLRPCLPLAPDSISSYTLWTLAKGFAAEGWVYPQNIRRAAFTGLHPIQQLPAHQRIPLKAKILRTRLLDRLFQADERAAYKAEYALLAAIAFGDRSELPQNLRDTYAQTGAAHLLALSGMHIGIIYFLLLFLFGGDKVLVMVRPFLGRGSRVPLSRRQLIVGEAAYFLRVMKQTLVASLPIVIIWGYVVLVGMPASAVRAATMLTFHCLGRLLGANSNVSVNILLAAALLMLLVDPLMLLDIGFQMSFLAMLSILLFLSPMQEWCAERINRLVWRLKKKKYERAHRFNYVEQHFWAKTLLGLFLVSLSAQVLTAPLTVFYFHRFSFAFPITNIVAVPIAYALLYFMLALLLISGIPVVGPIATKAVVFLASALNGCIAWISGFGLCVEGIDLSLPVLAIIYLAIAVGAIGLRNLVRRKTAYH